MFNLLSRENTN